jgi:hypothetical protein
LAGDSNLGYLWDTRMASKSSFSCPVCGENVPAKARACPHCGACEKSGWNEETRATDGLDLPGEDFDYEEFTAEEFGTPRKPRGKELLWKVTAVAIVVLMIIGFIANFLFR